MTTNFPPLVVFSFTRGQRYAVQQVRALTPAHLESSAAAGGGIFFLFEL
jgi:hypothetical protein